MKNYYLVETEDYTSRPKRKYRRTSMFTGIGRVIGLVLMLAGGFVIGQVVRGTIQGIMLLLGI